MRLLTIVALILASPEARAGGCHKAVVVEKQVVQAAVVTPLIQAVQIPLYNFSFVPTYAPQQQIQSEVAGTDCCTSLLAELTKLRAEVSSLRGIQPPTNGVAPAVGSSVMQTKCAGCHTAPNHKGEFALFAADGKRLPLSLQQKTRVRRAVLAGDMPKPTPGAAHVPLTQAEKDALIKELETP